MHRVGNFVLKRAIIGKQEQAFTIGIKPPRWVDIGDIKEIFKRLLAVSRAKLADHAVRFIEQNQHQYQLKMRRTNENPRNGLRGFSHHESPITGDLDKI